MKLTEKQKKNIIAAYASGEVSQTVLAKKYKVSVQMFNYDDDDAQVQEEYERIVEAEQAQNTFDDFGGNEQVNDDAIDNYMNEEYNDGEQRI